MTARAVLRSALLAVILGGLNASPLAAGGDWSFTPTATAEEAYSSNVRRTSEDSVGDLITTAGLDLPLAWRSSVSTVQLAYRPRYQWFRRERDLNALSQEATASWRRQGPRWGLDLAGSFARTDDPRLQADPLPGEPATPVEPGAAPLEVTRTGIDLTDLSAAGSVELTSRSSLEVRASRSTQRYESPGLLDNEDWRGRVRATGRATPRLAWGAALRVDAYRPRAAADGGLRAVEGSLEAVVRRPLVVALSAGAVIDARGALEDLSGRDRLFGSASLRGEHRTLRWAVGGARDFSSGAGVGTAQQVTNVSGSLTVGLGRSGSVGLQAARSDSRFVGDPGDGGSLITETYGVRYGRPLSARWSLAVEAGRSDQTGDASAEAVFREDRVAILATFSDARRS